MFKNKIRHIIVPLFCLAALLFAGCGPKIKITQEGAPVPGVKEGTLLRLAGTEVGEVTGVSDDKGFFSVEARIYNKTAPQVKSESAFLIKPAVGDRPAYIEVITIRPDSAPVADGTVYQFSLNQLRLTGERLARDWPKILIPLAAGAVTLLLLFACVRKFGQLAAIIFCFACGIAGAYFGVSHLTPFLRECLPAVCRPRFIACGGGFLAAYIVALLLVKLFRAPAEND